MMSRKSVIVLICHRHKHWNQVGLYGVGTAHYVFMYKMKPV
jgi:hypothetical protein